MQRLYYREISSDTLGVNESPSRPHLCLYCASILATAVDVTSVNWHERWMDYRFCPTCGWWDVVYREDDVMGNPEEDTYYQAILADFTKRPADIDFALRVLANEVSREPEAVFALPPRKMEQLVGSVFRNLFSCSIELTKTTHDGGFDLIGFNHQHGSFVVEIKRYARERKVGVALVRALLGAMCIAGMHQGVIVTTSSFSKDATKLQHWINTRTRWRIALQDFADLASWLHLMYDANFEIEQLDKLLGSALFGEFQQKYYQFPREFRLPGGSSIQLSPRF